MKAKQVITMANMNGFCIYFHCIPFFGMFSILFSRIAEQVVLKSTDQAIFKLSTLCNWLNRPVLEANDTPVVSYLWMDFFVSYFQIKTFYSVTFINDLLMYIVILLNSHMYLIHYQVTENYSSLFIISILE